MTIEARELYCFTTGTEPFATKAKELKNDLTKLKNLVSDAAGTYHSWYCTKGTRCFTSKDVDDVVVAIYGGVK